MHAAMPVSKSTSEYHVGADYANIVNSYFANFESLANAENWKEIISQGTLALEAAKKGGMKKEEAKISAQLTSSSFYLGDYDKALLHANRCHELSKEFQDPSLYVRALYLESAIYRALAPKKDGEKTQQEMFLQAVTTAEEAESVYYLNNIPDLNLLGKVNFNLGAAHADNSKGDLEKAENCYAKALLYFAESNAKDDVIRTSIRLGKVYLLQKKYDLSQGIINDVRPNITNERLAMQTDYLEGQLKLVMKDYEGGLIVSRTGLVRAQALGAKEDESRLTSLLQSIESEMQK